MLPKKHIFPQTLIKEHHKYCQHLLQFIHPYISYWKTTEKEKRQIQERENNKNLPQEVGITVPVDTCRTSLLENPVPIDVGFINYSWLEDISGSLLEELPQCKCGVYLNYLSEIIEKDWICSLCGNETFIGDTKKPINGTTLHAKIATKIVQPTNEISFIFCIDISESMKRTAVLRKEDGKEIYFQREGTFVSVWEVLMETAIELLDQIALEKPKAIVGLILFANRLYIHGDGENNPLIISSEQLAEGSSNELFYSPNSLFEYIPKYCKAHMTKPICQTKEKLKNILKNVKQEQFTALGPAIVSSLALLKNSKPGSQVLVMTDGRANCGCGILEGTYCSKNKEDNFYKTMAIPAKENGIIFSIFSFGADCALDGLIPLVQGTQGIARRINPEQEKKDIKIPYANSLITDIEVNILADPLLELTALDSFSEISPNKHQLRKTYKEIKLNSAYFFEYSLIQGDMKQIAREFITMQVQISYTTQMMRMRRIATEKIMLVPKIPLLKCSNYQAITRYAGEVIEFALQQSRKVQEDTLNKIKDLLAVVLARKDRNMILFSPSQNSRRDKCANILRLASKRLQKSLNDSKKSKDKLVILANTCATTSFF